MSMCQISSSWLNPPWFSCLCTSVTMFICLLIYVFVALLNSLVLFVVISYSIIDVISSMSLLKHLKIPKSNSCITLWGNNRILRIVMIMMSGPYNQKMHDHDFIIGNQEWLPKIHIIHIQLYIIYIKQRQVISNYDLI